MTDIKTEATAIKGQVRTFGAANPLAMLGIGLVVGQLLAFFLHI